MLQERFSQLIEAEVDRRLEAEAALRSERERQQRELLLLEKEQVRKFCRKQVLLFLKFLVLC